MSREADIVAFVDDAIALGRRGYRLLQVDGGEFRRVLTARAQPFARTFVLNAISHMPWVARFVHNRMGAKIDTAVAKAIDQAIDQLEQP